MGSLSPAEGQRGLSQLLWGTGRITLFSALAEQGTLGWKRRSKEAHCLVFLHPRSPVSPGPPESSRTCKCTPRSLLVPGPASAVELPAGHGRQLWSGSWKGPQGCTHGCVFCEARKWDPHFLRGLSLIRSQRWLVGSSGPSWQMREDSQAGLREGRGWQSREGQGEFRLAVGWLCSMGSQGGKCPFPITGNFQQPLPASLGLLETHSCPRTGVPHLCRIP